MAELVTLGWQVADWIETLLCHGPGDVQGRPLELDVEELAAVARMYQLTRTGRRTVRRYMFSRAKGRSKSEKAGAIVCAEALGPVRFSHWAKRGETSWWGYAYEKGEPVGRPVTYPFIRCLATEEGQSGNTYDNVVFMLTEGRVATEVTNLDVGLTRVFLPGGGEIRPSTASSAAKDGGKESFAVADETHLYVLPELQRMHATVRRNLVKRKTAEPWMLDTTTAWLIGDESIAEQTASAAKTAGLVIDHRQGPEPQDWADDRQLLAALTEAYGPAAEWMDLDRVVADIRDPLTDPADARRYFLNRPVTASQVGWLNAHPGAWGRCKSDLRLADGQFVTIGVDMSLNHDASAVAVVGDVDGRAVIDVKVWEPPRGGVVDHLEILEHIRSLCRKYVARSVSYDPRYFELLAKMLADEGVPVLEVPQSPERMTPICGHLLDLIVSGRAAHDGDPILTTHVLSADKRTNDRGFTLSKGRSRGHIDACIATALACWELEQSTADPALNVW